MNCYSLRGFFFLQLEVMIFAAVDVGWLCLVMLSQEPSAIKLVWVKKVVGTAFTSESSSNNLSKQFFFSKMFAQICPAVDRN